jgi:hypothetical protein
MTDKAKLEAALEALRPSTWHTQHVTIDRHHAETLYESSKACLDTLSAKRWRHKKRGTTYVEIGRGILHNSSWPLDEGTPMVIYMNPASGHYWVRSEGEFATRFEPLEGAST